jgi:nucleoside 2-deoxyribosyltransferase
MIYLAAPYSHRNPAVEEERFQAVCLYAAKLINSGIHVFSPIAHCHSIGLHGLPGDWNFWKDFDRAFLEICDEVWVLMIDGWQESKGVHAEINIAVSLGKSVVFVKPDEIK